VPVESKFKGSGVTKCPHFLPEEEPMFEQLIRTSRNQKITKVYYRKNKAPRSLAPHSPPVFDASHYMKEAEVIRTPLKRRATPVVAQELRRSKRAMSANKGYKPPSLSDIKGKKKGKSISKCSLA
jgi:hypothetical protein